MQYADTTTWRKPSQRHSAKSLSQHQHQHNSGPLLNWPPRSHVLDQDHEGAGGRGGREAPVLHLPTKLGGAELHRDVGRSKSQAPQATMRDKRKLPSHPVQGLQQTPFYPYTQTGALSWGYI